MLWNADAFVDHDPQDLLSTHERAGAAMTLAVVRVDRGADLTLHGGRVLFVDRRHRPGVGGFLYIGVAVVSADAAESLNESSPRGLAEALLRPMAQRNEIALHVHDGYALDVGTPGRYVQANLDALYERGPAPPVPFPGALVQSDQARSYRGVGADVEAGSIRSAAVVMRRARVLSGARLDHAVVWPSEIVPAGVAVTNALWALGRPHMDDVDPTPATPGP